MNPSANVIDFPVVPGDCEHCLGLFDCPFAHADELAQSRTLARTLRSGEHLFRAGDPVDGVFAVRSGAIKTYVLTADGEEQVLGLYGPGALVGVDAVGRATQACSAVALDVSSACPVSMTQLTRGCARSRVFCQDLLAAMGERVRHDEAQFVVLGRKSADQRVASFLVEQIDALARRRQPTDELLLPMPRADIASYLAMAVETVSRVLTRLQAAGVIRVNRNLITVADEAALREAASAESASAAAPRPASAS